MEDIYVQTEHERNSIAAIPDGLADQCGTTLFSWLGSLWRGLHEGEAMVRGLQSARGIQMAQLYIDILEALKLQDRNGAPVFHRDLWHPIVVRRSERDSAQENMLKMGGTDRKLGPQPPGSDYGYGYVFQMGRLANYENYVTYPVDPGIVGGAVSIVDNIVNPTVFMERGTDFDIRNNSVVFHRDNDPVGEGSAFDKYDVPGIDPSDPGMSDVEVVLWASDVLVDRDYIANHLSYALGANAPSSAEVKRILNAAWSSVASGLTPELITTLIAAMLNVPVIQSAEETVIDVEQGGDGSSVVVTDRGKYRISPKARLRRAVRSGAVMRRGEMLDESLRIYPYINSIPDGGTGYSVPLEEDVPSIVLPPGIIRARTEHGVYAMWPEAEVKEKTDSAGRQRLYFDIGGTDEDVASFWKDIWDKADMSGIRMADIIGEKGSKISPAKFFAKNLVGANTIFVVVDRSQVDDASMMRDPMFFDMLTRAVPSAVRLFVVEHMPADEDAVDVGEAREDDFMAAALPEAVDCVSEAGLPGMSAGEPSMGERVFVRFIRLSPEKIRGAKEGEQ